MVSNPVVQLPLVIAGLSVTALSYGLYKLAQAGLFQQILFDVKPIPSNKVWLVKCYKGHYKEIHSKFMAMFKLIAGRNDWEETVGIYFDDPTDAGINNCRYAIGLCLPSSATEFQAFLTDNGYMTVKVEKDKSSLHCIFPFVSTSMLSVWLSIMKVYPACDKEMKRRGLVANKDGAVVEITREGQTEFYFMLEKSDEIVNVRNKAISA